MRVITLPSDRKEAERTFNLYYTACFGGEGAKDHAAGRKLGKLQDAIEAISHEEDVPESELPDGVESELTAAKVPIFTIVDSDTRL